MKKLIPLLVPLALLTSCNESKDPANPGAEAAAKDKPAFAVTIDYWRKDEEKSAGGWVWVSPESLSSGGVKSKVEPPDNSATFDVYPKGKYLLQPTFLKHEDGLDHWELFITATKPAEEGGETTSEQTIQIAFDGTNPVPVFEDDLARLSLSAYQSTPFLPNEPRTIPLFTAFPPKANS